ncbi:MAG: laccase domain-containing protein [Candidatus Syntrophopropionicum ammoniitolerans]
MYEIVRKMGLEYFIFNHLQSSNLVTHGFTTRIGGVSTGCYHSLNTSFHVGDQDAHVQQNRVLACRALGIDPYRLVAGRQVHGDRIRLVEEKDLGRVPFPMGMPCPI